jgi:hypothetical protein
MGKRGVTPKKHISRDRQWWRVRVKGNAVKRFKKYCDAELLVCLSL